MKIDRPNIVYKYHKNNQYLLDLISNGELWFSHQNELNDPFDCKYAISDKYLKQTLKSASETMLDDLKKRVPSFESVNQDDFFEMILPFLKNNDWMNGLYNILFGDLGRSICCFTTNPLNELMWAHYADNYKGVCLGFDLSKTPKLNEILFPVTYNNTFPEINSMEEIQDAFLRKRTVWSYEEEWRIISNTTGKNAFNKESLTSIYFGYNFDKSKIDIIRQLMRQSGYKKVDFKQLNFRIKGVTINKLDNSKPQPLNE